MRVYLDHNATAPLCAPAREAMLHWLGRTGNASSVHAEGRAARDAISVARLQVARALGLPERDAERCVVFTSGATEANRRVLEGAREVVTTAIEHPSVALPAKARGARVVPVDRAAQLDPEAARAALTRDALFAVVLAHHELGVIADVARLRELAIERSARLHLDATQAFGRIPVDVQTLGCDTLAVSGHKIGGPQGVGALVAAPGIALPTDFGGHQERGRRAGTENVLAIVGFGAACEAVEGRLRVMPEVERRRDRLLAGLGDLVESVITAPARLPNTLCLRAPGVDAEGLVMALDLAGVAVSRGAACTSGTTETSPSLRALGLTTEQALEVFRVSLGPETDDAAVELAVERIERVLRRLRGLR